MFSKQITKRCSPIQRKTKNKKGNKNRVNEWNKYYTDNLYENRQNHFVSKD